MESKWLGPDFFLISASGLNDELWPRCVVFGVLDVVMFAEFGPLSKIRITLEDAGYHEVDSSETAFRKAGRDAGRRVIETVTRDRLIHFGT